jgi:hypothetical protein
MYFLGSTCNLMLVRIVSTKLQSTFFISLTVDSTVEQKLVITYKQNEKTNNQPCCCRAVIAGGSVVAIATGVTIGTVLPNVVKTLTWIAT